MGSLFLSGGMMVGGLVLSFVPPFIFGPILFAVGLVMGIKGLFGTAKTAAKVTAAGVNMVKEHNAAKDQAARLADLEAREQALAAREAAAQPRS